jgi:hypothetical protein
MRSLNKLVALGLVAAMAAGCGATPADRAVAVNGADTAGPAQAARPYIGKPRPPVTVTLATGASLESGVPGQLTLQVRSGAPLEAVRLTVNGDEGLTVVGFKQVPATEAAGRQAARFEIAATPTSGGTRYVSGLLSFRINGVAQAVPFKLPVQVGGPVTVAPVAQKPERPPARDSKGELIDSMPAETTVR